MTHFWLCFVPLFVAVDAIGLLPLFLSLTEGVKERDLRRIILQSVLTATAVAIGFLVLGQAVLSLLGITVDDFMIAGGILLFGIAFSDILSSEKPQRTVDPESLGAVPLGVPLICGPAVLATSLLLRQQQGFAPAAAAILVNVILAGVILSLAPRIHRVLGKAGAKTVSKIASLLLAAIAVMMVRRGLTHFIAPGA